MSRHVLAGQFLKPETLNQVHSLVSPDCLLPLGLVLTLPRLQHSLASHTPLYLHQTNKLVVNKELQAS